MTESGADTEYQPGFVLADVLLQRAALVSRMAMDRAPEPLAGLKVDDDDVLRLLAELPGLYQPDLEAVSALEAQLKDVVDDATVEFHRSLSGDGRLAWLTRRAALGPAEAEVLAVLCAVEMDPRRQRLVGYLNDDVTQKRLTPWVLRQLWGSDPGPLRAVGPAGGLRRSCLLASFDGPWASSSLAPAQPLIWWLAGAGLDDPNLPPGTRIQPGSTSARDPGEGRRASKGRKPSPPRLADHEPIVVVTAGPDRRRRLEALSARLDQQPMLIAQPPDGADAEGQWEALIRQATLSGCALVLEIDKVLPPGALDRIERATHLSWGLSSHGDLPVPALPRRPWVAATAATSRSTPQEWTDAFGPGVEEPPHRLSADQLDAVAIAARALDGDVDAAFRRLAAGHIEATAARIRPSRGWDDLVLDASRTAQVKEVATRCRRRNTVFDEWGFAPEPSVGVVALFTGPSGTGKTLAAEVIASELGVDLYKIDLANMVSKYIGETEKNLAGVFDAAEASNVALFFDEADALFGKRSAVSDAHDRYANIEVAYLLQRLEAYQGLAVMATNLAKNIDPAFVRRMHVVVEFPVPGPAERRRIWARCLPERAPIDADLDLDALSQHLELTGGTIRNAALGAAFLAADAGRPIGMTFALAAVERELQKIGRLVSATDLDKLRPA